MMISLANQLYLKINVAGSNISEMPHDDTRNTSSEHINELGADIDLTPNITDSLNDVTRNTSSEHINELGDDIDLTPNITDSLIKVCNRCNTG